MQHTVLRACLAGALCLALQPGRAGAQESSDSSGAVITEADLDSGSIAWMLTSSALVLMMTAPGLALFYGGLVRKKNILSVMMQSLFLMALMSVVWALWGYSFAFGGLNPYVGNVDHLLLKGVIPDGQLTAGDAVEELPDENGGWDAAVVSRGWVNRSIFAAFQGMFFIITPALICGAFAERMRFSTMCVFMVLWGTFVYCPIAHWVWSDNGWLCEANPQASLPAFDFAGGTVVHISSGFSALICSLLIGKRLGFGQEPMPPHNLTYTCIGAALLWVGWFGFNAGSALAANGAAVNAFLATHLATAGGVLAWCIAEWRANGRPSILGACSGAVAGLVCITPAAGAVNPVQGILLGAIAGFVCFFACTKVKNSFGYDDSLDAFGVHGVGGTVGAILVGIFATGAVTGGRVGVIEGNVGQILNQIVAIAASVLLAVAGTLIILKILDAVMGLRVTQDDEIMGLDLSQHGEEGYIFL